jgi:hypothetical protein
MRKALWAAAIIIGFAATANAAPPTAQQTGTVTTVDRADKIFQAQTNNGTSTYKTTPRTIFRVGAKPANWGAVLTGSKVAIIYHVEGKSPIADEIIVTQ